jgi:dTDP-4-dehydrorhamnose 3,5-epimerase
MLTINKFDVPGLIEIVPEKHYDNRGSFHESFNLKDFEKHQLQSNFVQENESISDPGVFRGFHLQKDPFAQGKLVRAITGRALDIVIDLRTSSPKYKTVFAKILDSKKGNMLYVPPGFAHGFLALDKCVFSYKCTDFYNKENETGVSIFSKSLNLRPLLKKYGFRIQNLILSDKDKKLPSLKKLLSKLTGPQYS